MADSILTIYRKLWASTTLNYYKNKKNLKTKTVNSHYKKHYKPFKKGIIGQIT